MSFKPYTEKIKKKKNWNLLDFRSDPDPSSRKRIRGSGSASKWYGSETLIITITFTMELLIKECPPGQLGSD